MVFLNLPSYLFPPPPRTQSKKLSDLERKNVRKEEENIYQVTFK